MDSFSKVIIIFALLLMVLSCANSIVHIPEKYRLDAQLERVDEIQDLRAGRRKPAFSDFEESFEDALSVIARRDTVTLNETNNEWIKVDEQSFVIRSVKNEYYLLVLDTPAPNLMTTSTITFQLLAGALRARADYLQIENATYLIELIYRINGKDELYTISNQIITRS